MNRYEINFGPNERIDWPRVNQAIDRARCEAHGVAYFSRGDKYIEIAFNLGYDDDGRQRMFCSMSSNITNGTFLAEKHLYETCDPMYHGWNPNSAMLATLVQDYL